jgi:hypothetical protein
MGYLGSELCQYFFEAGLIACPPRLIRINQGGHFKVFTSVNRFYEAVFVTTSVNKK